MNGPQGAQLMADAYKATAAVNVTGTSSVKTRRPVPFVTIEGKPLTDPSTLKQAVFLPFEEPFLAGHGRALAASATDLSIRSQVTIRSVGFPTRKHQVFTNFLVATSRGYVCIYL